MARLEARTIHSLEKVFPDSDGLFAEAAEGCMFRNERFSYGIALRSHAENWGRRPLQIAVESPIADHVEVRHVGLVPSRFPAYEGADRYLRTTPGLYPDVLEHIEDGSTSILYRQWEWLWVFIRGDEGLPVGRHPVTVRLTTGEDTAETTFTIEVLPEVLPEQRLLFTQWFHCDGIAQYHHVPMFSEPFWDLARAYIRMAADYGITMLLTPLFTPPLDVQVGGERMTCQLVDVTKEGEEYRFGFDRLDRWIELCEACGIHHFEMSHLFTQWGAKAIPKIVAQMDGREERIFGWDTPSDSPAYERFLSQFLPALDRYLRDKGIAERCYFHVSDEPGLDQLDSYTHAAALLHRYLPGYPVMDAMSNYEIYEQSGLSDPVVAINHIAPFLEAGVNPLWGYYCCGQHTAVSNRFMAMPSGRNRILGIQAYKYGFKGFLQWGYNFYNSQYSLRPIDPYAVTDADGGFPSGDAFSVYPTPDGCIESLRLAVFYDGLQDYRALTLLEQLTDRETALAFLREQAGDLTLTAYPQDPAFFTRFRTALGRRITEAAGSR